VDIASLDWINYTILVEKIVFCIWQTALFTIEAPPEETNSGLLGDIIKNAKILFLNVLISKPELLSTLYSLNDVETFVMDVLLRSPNNKIREEMVDGICQLCTELDEEKLPGQEHPKKFFLPLLRKFLSNASNYAEQCEQYFDGLSVLIKNEALTLESKNLLHQVIGLLKEHPIVEVCEL
jgi:hypothetical protein